MLRKIAYSFAVYIFLWTMWLCGLLMMKEPIAFVLNDAFKYWVLAPIMPLFFLIWISLLYREETKERIVADVFPGWDVITWIWTPFLFQLIVVWIVSSSL